MAERPKIIDHDQTAYARDDPPNYYEIEAFPPGPIVIFDPELRINIQNQGSAILGSLRALDVLLRSEGQPGIPMPAALTTGLSPASYDAKINHIAKTTNPIDHGLLDQITSARQYANDVEQVGRYFGHNIVRISRAPQDPTLPRAIARDGKGQVLATVYWGDDPTTPSDDLLRRLGYETDPILRSIEKRRTLWHRITGQSPDVVVESPYLSPWARVDGLMPEQEQDALFANVIAHSIGGNGGRMTPQKVYMVNDRPQANALQEAAFIYASAMATNQYPKLAEMPLQLENPNTFRVGPKMVDICIGPIQKPNKSAWKSRLIVSALAGTLAVLESQHALGDARRTRQMLINNTLVTPLPFAVSIEDTRWHSSIPDSIRNIGMPTQLYTSSHEWPKNEILHVVSWPKSGIVFPYDRPSLFLFQGDVVDIKASGAILRFGDFKVFLAWGDRVEPIDQNATLGNLVEREPNFSFLGKVALTTYQNNTLEKIWRPRNFKSSADIVELLGVDKNKKQ